MKDTTYVPLKNDLLMRLIERYKENYPFAIDDVIEEFLKRTSDEDSENTRFRDGGYIWAQVALPSGTQLRTRYFDEWHTAKLENGKFYFNEQAYKSPAKVCNAMRGNKNSNAWIMLQVKRPNDPNFQKAEKLRD